LALEAVLDGTLDNRFSLDAVIIPPPNVLDAAKPAPEPMALDAILRAHAAAGTAAYCWNVIDDTISWSGNAGEVLQCDVSIITTGRKFADFLDSSNVTSRYETVMGASHREARVDGVPFEIEYRLRPQGRQNQHSQQSLWVEDCGRWFGTAETGPALVYGTLRVIENRHIHDQEMNFLASSDDLTGMMNRGRMLKALDEAITHARGEKTSCAFAILAVNNLDVMNDTYGYEVADEVIAAIAERLRKVMRIGDAIARYSRAKFGIILNGCGPDELGPALERFMRAIRDNVIETSLGPIWALISIGAVNLPATADTAPTASACAEEALSEALQMPGDGFSVYESSDQKMAERLLNARCATEIVSCLRGDRFKLAFQPVCEAKTGEPAFHEALLRMQDSTGELVTAGHLVPVAEKLGLIRLIDRAVVQLALSTLTSHPAATLSINLSATTVRDPRWNAQILDALTNAPELASRLIIEVTETAALADCPGTRAFLKDLKHAGCRISIDDFGAGLTSYRNLKELPVSVIKLYGSLCRKLDEDGGNGVYVRSMVELAHALGMKVVGEWVESREEAEALAAIGVDFLQGNLVGEPSITEPWEKTEGEDLLQFEVAPAAEPEREFEPVPAAAVTDADLDHQLQELKALLENLHSSFGVKDETPEKPGDLAIAS
jgi:diguanylate cyclase (GGDEF)-like protein